MVRLVSINNDVNFIHLCRYSYSVDINKYKIIYYYIIYIHTHTKVQV